MKEKTKNIIIVIVLIIIILILLALLFLPDITNMIESATEDRKLTIAKSEADIILSGINTHCAIEEMKVQMNSSDANPCAESLSQEEIETMVYLDDSKVEKAIYNGEEITELVLVIDGYRLTLVGEEFEVVED